MSEVEVEAEPQERDFEAEATNMGWHDPKKDDFRGDKENALSAEDFVKKGEKELPILRDNNRKLQRIIDENESSKKEFKKFMTGQLEKEKSAHEALKRQAVEDGDTDRYDELNKNAPKETQKEDAAEKESAIEIEFKQRNTWYGVDKKRTQVAMNVDHELRALRNVLSPTEYAERVEAKVEELMPTKAAHNTVASPRKKLGATKSKTFEAMPQENRDACSRMEKSWGITKESYVKSYYEGLENDQ